MYFFFGGGEDKLALFSESFLFSWNQRMPCVNIRTLLYCK